MIGIANDLLRYLDSAVKIFCNGYNFGKWHFFKEISDTVSNHYAIDFAPNAVLRAVASPKFDFASYANTLVVELTTKAPELPPLFPAFKPSERLGG
ncbi:hypothetical protein RJJ65_08740 [Rhizobium hidalgonense]|uniref:Uncharacterized protein n=1 Tax=Rhizobium hidalgonense TaxID=1538159 RepID=A0AAJ2LJ05_9HYPH|nr:hypothetical protein [Rhizobium hidalgonense]MDR9772742.1 hypothetical protein [Rhizobium hidalgonense]MDR9820202.1 hypothetical protein [Rhizobium hidalgonense]